MIDEQAVLAAQFWKSLRSLADRDGLREEEAVQFGMLAVALAYMSEARGSLATDLVRDAKDAIASLQEAANRHHPSEFEELWRRKGLALLVKVSRSEYDREVVLQLAPPETFLSIIEMLRHWPTETDKELRLQCFDELFHRTVAHLIGTEYRAGDAAAALGAHLSEGSRAVTDYFAATAEFAVLRKARDPALTDLRVAPMPRLSFFIGLRLAIHDIPYQPVAPDRDDFGFLLARRFVFVDHPRRSPTTGQRQSNRRPDQRSTLGALETLLRSEHDVQEVLLIVPGADRSARGWRLSMRRHLVESGRLLAVVDMPSVPGKSSSTQTSAWLIASADRPRSSPTTLFIDSKRLGLVNELRDPSHLMAFVGGIIQLPTADAQASAPTGRGATRRPSSELKSMFDVYFRDGYRDVPGICRRVSRADLEDNDFQLRTSPYLSSPPGRTWLPLLDSEIVLDLLDRGTESGSRIYVIGNNGEGKSMLLADLAERLAHRRIQTIGISFGLSDRFTFKPPQGAYPWFTYLGARTGQASITRSRTSTELIRLVKDIHFDQARLDVFNEVVEHLGFGERRYLVPEGLDNMDGNGHSHYEDVQRLSDIASENHGLFDGFPKRRQTLGLMRRDADKSITPFSDMSSGEQQFLTLAVKLTRHAGANTVILVDEPEISLHVSWQRAIPAMFEIIGQRLKCSIVVATHSPVVIASANHPTDRCFVARQRTLTELGSRQRRSVETALFDGFKTYTTNNREVHERCASMVAQTIERLNGPADISAGGDDYVDQLRAELSEMTDIIRHADSVRLENAQDDLALIGRTRSAIEELVTVMQVRN